MNVPTTVPFALAVVDVVSLTASVVTDGKVENNQPELFPLFVLPLDVKALHVAPPMASLYEMSAYSTVTVPLALDKVCGEEALELVMVIGSSAVPTAVKLFTIVVVPS